MNIIFRDKLSQQAWHATRRFNDAHRKALDHWIGNFLAGAWCDHSLPETMAKYDRPDYAKQTGGMGQLVIHAPWNDLDLIDGKLVVREFAWAVENIPVNTYGGQEGEPKTVIVGGFINHGTNEKPSWSSHT